MTMLSCPLCGKMSSLRYFNPEALPNDIQLVERRSLGRAKGFEVTGRPSALRDAELMNRIAARLHILLDLIEEPGSSDVEELEDEMEGMLERINVAFNTEFEYLEDAVDFLIDLYSEKRTVQGKIARML